MKDIHEFYYEVLSEEEKAEFTRGLLELRECTVSDYIKRLMRTSNSFHQFIARAFNWDSHKSKSAKYWIDLANSDRRPEVYNLIQGLHNQVTSIDNEILELQNKIQQLESIRDIRNKEIKLLKTNISSFNPS